MSDLQCPARLLLVSAQDTEVLGRLPGQRVAMVYDGQGSVSEQADALGEALGVPVRALGEDLAVGAVRAQEPAAMQVLRDVADLHRGETVLVLLETETAWEVSIDGDGVAVTPVRPGH